MTSHPPAPSDRGLGHGFGRLFWAAVATNLGDGLSRVAVPLVAVTLTRDPLAVSVLGALAVLPWLLFGIHAGVLVDRHDRRRVMAIANGMRVVTVVAVLASIVADSVNLVILGAATVLFGVGEVLADNATNAIMPAVVRKDALDRANGRIQAAQIGVDTFVATPLGGVLFALAVTLPLLLATGAFAAVVVLALALPASAARARSRAVAPPLVVAPGESLPDGDVAEAVGPDRGEAATGEAETPVRARDGIAFLWNYRWLRWMTLLTSATAAFLTFAQATTLLLFLDSFGVPEAAIGVVTAGVGLGGLAGALGAPMVVARFGRGRVMLGGILAAGAGLTAVGLAPNLPVAIGAYAISACGVGVWNVPWGATRQSVIPSELLGRVLGFGRTIGWGLIPIASIAGGLVARLSLTTPLIIGGLAIIALGLVGAVLILATDRQPSVSDAEDEQVFDEEGRLADDAEAPPREAVPADVV
ncbi:MFS transporter [Demequina zhanjiangensis]|uniref:MFS transporter n=1 Tax=Demequina zhanjiangensis TaxID=3051659 RepID=A0ABT8G360_9MICO|nr:MFS transporter [Demequina sp. SYSU T00b26]MDN4473565.1 MFS transporter [Demequina sp. SYSU T00b26]